MFPFLCIKLVYITCFHYIFGTQELKFDADSATYFLDSFPKNFDVGKYTFVFEVLLLFYILHTSHTSHTMYVKNMLKASFFLKILLDESAIEKGYITQAQTKVPIAATGAIGIENAEISVLDSDVGSIESQKKYVTLYLSCLQNMFFLQLSSCAYIILLLGYFFATFAG